MQYRYALNRNFEDFASGRVFYARPGQPAFPVRLASEIFQRSLTHWRAAGGQGRLAIYDPVCGGAYWLAVLGSLHRDEIAAIYASDIDPEVLPLAERNLSLLTPAGLDQRIVEIETMLAEYGKESHAEALQSARQFSASLVSIRPASVEYAADRRSAGIETTPDTQPADTITSRVFQADATDPESLSRGLGDRPVDLVLADVPYGWHSSWVAGEGDQPPVGQMLEALQPLLKPGAVVAVAVDKGQKVGGADQLQRVEHFRAGKRRVFIHQKRE